MRNVAFIDIETTGLEADYHDIVEIAAIRIDPSTWEVQTELNYRVHPEHPERIDPEAVRINRYSADLWKDALQLSDALAKLTPVLNGCVIAGHNVHFDWSFLLAAYRRHEIVQPEVDYHLLDTASLAWPLVIAGVIERPTLRALCDLLGVSNDGAHSALGDARRAMNVYRRLAEIMNPSWLGMQASERSIAGLIIERLNMGRDEYGPWRVADDKRHYPREALLEIVDALSYCAAQLVRLDEQERKS